ncbi:uncharacterized protein METZ01_LOCUS505972 [marine metagenome]|uniref:Uncharacterized protein n=1 Tax=marine metagenome TaxID=408172 RepID=A0A383EAI5_9ZZZZ
MSLLVVEKRVDLPSSIPQLIKILNAIHSSVVKPGLPRFGFSELCIGTFVIFFRFFSKYSRLFTAFHSSIPQLLDIGQA